MLTNICDKNVINKEPTYDIIAYGIVGGDAILLANDARLSSSPSLLSKNYEYCKGISHKENIVGGSTNEDILVNELNVKNERGKSYGHINDFLVYASLVA